MAVSDVDTPDGVAISPWLSEEERQEILRGIMWVREGEGRWVTLEDGRRVFIKAKYFRHRKTPKRLFNEVIRMVEGEYTPSQLKRVRKLRVDGVFSGWLGISGSTTVPTKWQDFLINPIGTAIRAVRERRGAIVTINARAIKKRKLGKDKLAHTIGHEIAHSLSMRPTKFEATLLRGAFRAIEADARKRLFPTSYAQFHYDNRKFHKYQLGEHIWRHEYLAEVIGLYKARGISKEARQRWQKIAKRDSTKKILVWWKAMEEG